MFAKLLIAAVALPALLVRADPNPIIPGPGDSYKEGGNCMIQWEPDTTGKWTSMVITLKTGDNYNMVPLTTVATVDGTKQTQYTYPCPNVSPNSAIYFYEFSTSSSTEKYWTTRFTITDPEGNSTPPPQTTQPNGDNIAWGTGNLLSNGNSSSLAVSSSSSSGPSSLPSGSSSSLRGSSSSRISTSSSRSSSTGSPSPNQTGTSQSSSSGGFIVAVPKVAAFLVGFVASAAFLS